MSRRSRPSEGMTQSETYQAPAPAAAPSGPRCDRCNLVLPLREHDGPLGRGNYCDDCIAIKEAREARGCVR